MSHGGADLLTLQAKIADMGRKIDGLQRMVYGRDPSEYSAADLQSLYWEACRRLGDLAPREVFLWSCLIRNLGAAQLLTLGRLVQDPFPWKPFLALLDHATAQDFLVDDVTEHLLDTAQDLLTAQGLWMLTPADLMGTPLAVHQAVEDIRSERAR
jgi:hypothetical protein